MHFNTLRPRQNGRHFADDIFKCIFLNENISIAIDISLKFVPEGRINNIPALVQIMAWRRLGDKPLSEPMMVSLLTHKCVTRPQWVKCLLPHGSHFVRFGSQCGNLALTQLASVAINPSGHFSMTFDRDRTCLVVCLHHTSNFDTIEYHYNIVQYNTIEYDAWQARL